MSVRPVAKAEGGHESDADDDSARTSRGSKGDSPARTSPPGSKSSKPPQAGESPKEAAAKKPFDQDGRGAAAASQESSSTFMGPPKGPVAAVSTLSPAPTGAGGLAVSVTGGGGDHASGSQPLHRFSLGKASGTQPFPPVFLRQSQRHATLSPAFLRIR